MPRRNTININTGESVTEDFTASPERTAYINAHAQQQGQQDAKAAQRAARLVDIPAHVNSVPALRAVVQGLIEEIR